MSDDPEQNGAVDFIGLAEFRYRLRRFLRFSEEAARAAGIQPQQYQFLLAIKGLPEGVRSRIGELAERMQLQHHSTVELVDRLEKQGLVQRRRSAEDRREVLVSLTARGDKLVRELAVRHIDELRTAAPPLITALRRVSPGASPRPNSRKGPPQRRS